MRVYFWIFVAFIVVACNHKDNNGGKVTSNSQIELAKKFQASLLDELEQSSVLNSLGGSWGRNSSFAQFSINDSAYDHSNTSNHALKVYLKWKEKMIGYKINPILQGNNRFSFEFSDDRTTTLVDVISYPLKKINLIEFMIRTI